ncbi:hypothetical protein N656DRAFT_775408 [Canariomyces notabilis]|uniref:Uncharacterized protein n=1 Tax=Canariomyces notabilis TaxID=2074819 RepID=A0AAN6YVG1_9PEZI|nr:hypothetical protein N656DRAFT_775408 [Canariomyces arenarius]
MSTGPSVASQRDKSRRQRLRELPAEFLRERPVSCRHCLWDKLKWLTLPSQREIDERNGGMILCQFERNGTTTHCVFCSIRGRKCEPVAQSVEARVQEFDRLYKAAFGKDENNPLAQKLSALACTFRPLDEDGNLVERDLIPEVRPNVHAMRRGGGTRLVCEADPGGSRQQAEPKKRKLSASADTPSFTKSATPVTPSEKPAARHPLPTNRHQPQTQASHLDAFDLRPGPERGSAAYRAPRFAPTETDSRPKRTIPGPSSSSSNGNASGSATSSSNLRGLNDEVEHLHRRVSLLEDRCHRLGGRVTELEGALAESEKRHAEELGALRAEVKNLAQAWGSNGSRNVERGVDSLGQEYASRRDKAVNGPLSSTPPAAPIHPAFLWEQQGWKRDREEGRFVVQSLGRHEHDENEDEEMEEEEEEEEEEKEEEEDDDDQEQEKGTSNGERSGSDSD